MSPFQPDIGDGMETYQMWIAFFQSRPSMHPPFTETTFFSWDAKSSVNRCRERVLWMRNVQESCG